MPKSRPVTITRLVSLIDYINRHPGVAVRELSDHFGRTPRQIRADVALLDQAGIDDLLPGSTLEIDWDLYNREGRLQLFSSLDVEAPVALTGEEVSRVILGLQMIAESLSKEERSHLKGTITTLLAASSQKPVIGEGVQTVVPLVNSAHFEAVRSAIDSGGCLAIDYRDAAGALSSRTIWPTDLHLRRDGWVIDAWCGVRKDSRSFRLDRIGKVRACSPQELEGEPVSQGTSPKAPTHPTQKQAGGREGGDEATVEVTLTKDADWVLGESVARAVHVDKESITATFDVWDDAWMTAEIIALAPYIQSTKPTRHLLAAVEHARAALNLWDSITPQTGEEND